MVKTSNSSGIDKKMSPIQLALQRAAMRKPRKKTVKRNKNTFPVEKMVLQSKILACDQMIEELSISDYSKRFYATTIGDYRRKRRALVRQFTMKYSK